MIFQNAQNAEKYMKIFQKKIKEESKQHPTHSQSHCLLGFSGFKQVFCLCALKCEAAVLSEV